MVSFPTALVSPWQPWMLLSWALFSGMILSWVSSPRVTLLLQSKALGGVRLLHRRLSFSMAALDDPVLGPASLDDPILRGFSPCSLDAPIHGSRRWSPFP